MALETTQLFTNVGLCFYIMLWHVKICTKGYIYFPLYISKIFEKMGHNIHAQMHMYFEYYPTIPYTISCVCGNAPTAMNSIMFYVTVLMS